MPDCTLVSTLHCPACGHAEALAMPTDACLFFHQCSGCHTLMRPKAGDCCVFCSYGSVPCPPIQLGARCGSGGAKADVGGGDAACSALPAVASAAQEAGKHT